MSKSIRNLAAGLALLTVLAACGQSPGDGGGAGDLGVISGQIVFGSGGAFADSGSDADFVPGELIVVFDDAAELAAQSGTLGTAGLSVQFSRPLADVGLGAPAVYSNPGLSDEELLTLAAGLSGKPGIRHVLPNYIFELFATPTDEHYGGQWHYPQINLPAAWDITTGSPDTVIAVVDSGILYSPSNPQGSHPDFGPANILPGYDFVSNVQTALDGDGRDADPFDPGDFPGGQSTYHGSHVAGTIAALTNTDGRLGAGVNWQAKILPVRVMGAGGKGNTADIYEGMLWAAGFTWQNMTMPPNQNPADIINMSLGASFSCTDPQVAVIQDMITAVVEAGSILVVAAGNDTTDVANITPAGCQGVITVGATDAQNIRAPYSNFGSGVHIMAPGGNVSANTVDPNWPDGVLSAGRDDSSGTMLSTFKDGTSMAAPHVAGVISLMLAVDPDLTWAQALQIIQGTAMLLPTGACTAPAMTGQCGAGLLDAHAAVLAAQGGGGSPDPGPTDPEPTDPDPTPWEPDPGTPNPGGQEPQGAMIVAAFQVDAQGQPVMTGNQTSDTPLSGFSFQALSGTTYVEAWSDENRNGTIDAGDYLGAHPFPIILMAGSSKEGVTVNMNLVTATSGVDANQAARLEALLD